MLVSLTVGKVDAGVTVLLTQDKRLIEFPSILLPPNISSGSIVDITVARNRSSEQAAKDSFAALQTRIYETFGVAAPAAPVLRCRNATQTSVVLEWDPIQLATADLVSLALYRNGQKAGNIPRPLQMHSTKISGLAVDTPYTFHLVLRTSAGALSSDKLAVRTHKMTNLSGITVSVGILPAAARERLLAAVDRIGARVVPDPAKGKAAPDPAVVRIDTTHFVTTVGRGAAWEKAVELNIPVVRPEWVEACEKSGRILGVTKYYLDAVLPATLSESEPVGPPQSRPADKDLPQSPPEHDDDAAAATTAAKPPPAAEPSSPSSIASSPPVAAPAPAPAADSSVASSPSDTHGPAHNMALRTRNEAADSGDEHDDDDDDDDDEKASHEPQAANGSADLGKPPAASGDGASFQDVDL